MNATSEGQDFWHQLAFSNPGDVSAAAGHVSDGARRPRGRRGAGDDSAGSEDPAVLSSQARRAPEPRTSRASSTTSDS